MSGRWRVPQTAARRLIRTHTMDQPEVPDAIAAMRRVADAYHDRVMIGEAYLPIDRLMTAASSSRDSICGSMIRLDRFCAPPTQSRSDFSAMRAACTSASSCNFATKIWISIVAAPSAPACSCSRTRGVTCDRDFQSRRSSITHQRKRRPDANRLSGESTWFRRSAFHPGPSLLLTSMLVRGQKQEGAE